MFMHQTTAPYSFVKLSVCACITKSMQEWGLLNDSLYTVAYKKAKVSSDRAQDCSKRFTSLADLFNQTPSQLPWEASLKSLQREVTVTFCF